MKIVDEVGNINAGLFLFYLALISNYTMDRVLPPDVIKFFDRSRMGKHVVAFLVLLFTINLYTPKLPFFHTVGYTFGIWVWYLLTSKQHLTTSFIILGLLLASYVAFNISKDLENSRDKTMEELDHEREMLSKFQLGCFVGIIIASTIGGYSYFIEHYRQYRDEDSSFLDFLTKYLFMGKGDRSRQKAP
jgi:hypothetical protein